MSLRSCGLLAHSSEAAAETGARNVHCSRILPRALSGLRGYFADAGKTGNLSTSRASCWMMTVALEFAAIFLTRSSEASVWARSELNHGTPLVS